MLIYLQLIEDEYDRNKFLRIYKMYSRLMFYVANEILHNEQDAEDAVHQAFLEIIERIDKIHPPENPEVKTLVCLIARHRAIDIARERDHYVDIQIYDAGYDGGFIIDNNDLASAMSRIEPQYRDALLLRFEYGYSVIEMAKIMKKKPDTVRKLLWRAKNALKKELDKENNDE